MFISNTLDYRMPNKKTTDSQPSVLLVKFEVLYNIHQNNALCMLISYIYVVISD